MALHISALFPSSIGPIIHPSIYPSSHWCIELHLTAPALPTTLLALASSLSSIYVCTYVYRYICMYVCVYVYCDSFNSTNCAPQRQSSHELKWKYWFLTFFRSIWQFPFSPSLSISLSGFLMTLTNSCCSFWLFAILSLFAAICALTEWLSFLNDNTHTYTDSCARDKERQRERECALVLVLLSLRLLWCGYGFGNFSSVFCLRCSTSVHVGIWKFWLLRRIHSLSACSVKLSFCVRLALDFVSVAVFCYCCIYLHLCVCAIETSSAVCVSVFSNLPLRLAVYNLFCL